MYFIVPIIILNPEGIADFSVLHSVMKDCLFALDMLCTFEGTAKKKLRVHY